MSLVDILITVVIVILVLAEILAKIRHITLKQELADLKALFKKAPAVAPPAPAAVAAAAPAASPVTINLHQAPPAAVAQTVVTAPAAQEKIVTTKQLPANFPKDRATWTESKWQSEIVGAKTKLDAAIAAARATHTYTGPTTLGDVYSVWAGLVDNHRTIFDLGLIPAG